MATDSTQNPEREGEHSESDREAASRANQLASTVADHGRNGTLAMLTGGVLLARAAGRAARNRRRAAVQALVGAGLLGLGFRQRQSSGRASDQESIVRHGVKRETDTNPRGTSGEPEIETETDPDEGEVRYSDDQITGPHSEPHLEDTPEDPRIDDEGVEGEGVEIDLSDAAMADEASEATGPSPEQAQPASTEGTEPERTPPADVSHMEADKGGRDAERDEEPDESLAGGETTDAVREGDEMTDAVREGDETTDGGERGASDTEGSGALDETERTDEDEAEEEWDAGDLEDRPAPDEDEDEESDMA